MSFLVSWVLSFAIGILPFVITSLYEAFLVSPFLFVCYMDPSLCHSFVMSLLRYLAPLNRSQTDMYKLEWPIVDPLTQKLNCSHKQPSRHRSPSSSYLWILLKEYISLNQLVTSALSEINRRLSSVNLLKYILTSINNFPKFIVSQIQFKTLYWYQWAH